MGTNRKEKQSLDKGKEDTFSTGKIYLDDWEKQLVFFLKL